MKWLLAAMLYVALAAAAFTQTHWAYADVLWFVSFFAVCYAATLAFIYRGQRQAGAIGFLIGSLALSLTVHFAPDGVPTGRIVTAITPFQIVPTPGQPPPTISWQATPQNAPAYQNGPLPGYVGPTPTIASGSSSPTQYTRQVVISYTGASPIPDLTSRLRAANSLATMVAGFAVCLLSTVAFRRAQPVTVST